MAAAIMSVPEHLPERRSALMVPTDEDHQECPSSSPTTMPTSTAAMLTTRITNERVLRPGTGPTSIAQLNTVLKGLTCAATPVIPSSAVTITAMGITDAKDITDIMMVDTTFPGILPLSSLPTPTSPLHPTLAPVATTPDSSAFSGSASAPVSTADSRTSTTDHLSFTSIVPATPVPSISSPPSTSTSVLASSPTPRPTPPSTSILTTEVLLTTPSISIPGDTTTFFDDMINGNVPQIGQLLSSSSTDQLTRRTGVASIPELYHNFFDNHPELCDSDQSSSDGDLDMDLDEDVPVIRARTLAEMRQASMTALTVQVPLIADRRPTNTPDTIDTINLMNHPQHQQQRQQPNGGGTHSHSASNGTAPHTNSSSPNDNANNANNNNYNNNNNGRADDEGSGSPPDQDHQNQTPQRRKKASRACFHCQKAHLTCDDSRPCQRCIKRDLAATCADGVRKKAKYLQDAYDAQQLAAEQSGQTPQAGTNIDLTGIDQQQLLSDQDQPARSGAGSMDGSLTDTSALFNFPMSADYNFGSEAVNLEYSIISTMLSSPTAELNPMSDLSIVESWQRQGSLDAMANMANNNQLQKALAAQSAAAVAAAAAAVSGAGAGAGVPGPAGALSNGGSAHNNSSNGAAGSANTGLLGPGGAPTANNATNSTSSFQHTSAARVSKRKFPSNTPENVYANTKQPFNYTDGFHYLLRYVRERMDKEEMMRICRAMAMFRPSFIALIMNLTPEDLIFMEKCFQRTILEFEKLISFSGTPTVVWRRTGEIALVGKEFSLLTQWGRDQLVGKKTYIYELMDNQSAVEYWEKFSTHAFENTEQTVMTTCILLSPTNRVVPCTFCFTIKRDIFDIPLAIVGNFLPILS